MSHVGFATRVKEKGVCVNIKNNTCKGSGERDTTHLQQRVTTMSIIACNAAILHVLQKDATWLDLSKHDVGCQYQNTAFSRCRFGTATNVLQ